MCPAVIKVLISKNILQMTFAEASEKLRISATLIPRQGSIALLPLSTFILRHGDPTRRPFVRHFYLIRICFRPKLRVWNRS